MTIEPLTPSEQRPAARSSNSPSKPSPLTVLVTPATRYVGSERASFAAIKPGNYAGAAFGTSSSDTLHAQEVFLYDESLRGTGEGRFPEGDHNIVNGTVSSVKPASAPDKAASFMTLHYHGSVLTGLGRGKTLCEGRASPPAYASALACQSDAVIEVMPDTPVSWLREGDKSLLKPGSLVTVALSKTPDGKDVAPGVLVEKTLPPPEEKPQSSP